MDQIIEKIFTDPIFIKVGIVIAIFISLSLLKKLFKIVMVLILILSLYGYYVYTTGAEPIGIDEVTKTIDEFKKLDEKKLKKAADKAIMDIKKKVEKGLN